MSNIHHHKRMYSDIPNLKMNPRNTIVNSSLAYEERLQNSRETKQYNTNTSKGTSKGKEISPKPNQNLRKFSESKQKIKIQAVPNIKPKIGSDLLHYSGKSGKKQNSISPFQKKLSTPMKTNQTSVHSRNTSYNRIKPHESKFQPLNMPNKIPMIKNYLPPRAYYKAHTNRDDEINLTNLSKSSRLNDTNNSVLTSDRRLINDRSNSKSLSRNSKTSSKSRSDTPKFKNDANKRIINSNQKNIDNNINVKNNFDKMDQLNNIKNLNKTLTNLKSVSNSKSPTPQPKINSKISNNHVNTKKKTPKLNIPVPKLNNYTSIHVMSKFKTNMNTNNYNVNKKLNKNVIEMNYAKLYQSLLNNNSNTNTNMNDISTTSSKLDQLKDFKDKKITNNPSNNSIISNITNVTKEKDKHEYSYKIPFKYSDKDTNTKVGNIAENFKSDVKFKEITTSPLIRAKNDLNIPKLILDSAESKKEGKNLFELFKKTQDSDKFLVHNQNPIPMNIESYLKKIKSVPKESKKHIKMIHEFSHIGYSDDGTKKVNQDVYFKYKNLGGNQNQVFFGVCDGHGLHGHEVSGYLKDNLPVFLNHQIKVYSQESIQAIIEETFLEINFNLHTSDSIDTLYSGSTCASLIYTPEKLICANVGDSRAVLGKLRDGKWINYDLTRDHKPSEEDEARRIYDKGGRIEPFRDDETDDFIGPPRVWLKQDPVPGLAMSRSFGDRVASSVGVIAEPEITEYRFVDEDKFIIIASDGVWEFIESDECVELIKDFYLKKDPVACCEYIYKEACKRWMEEEECIDDITMILIFLDD